MIQNYPLLHCLTQGGAVYNYTRQNPGVAEREAAASVTVASS